MKNIFDSGKNGLEESLTQWGFPLYYAKQVFLWVCQKKATGFTEMSNLPLALRHKLEENLSFGTLKLNDLRQSTDGTEKFLFELTDKNLVEAVIIPAENRVTACLSSQAGCKFGCKFCASGLLGYKRDLSFAEILGEVIALKLNSLNREITHIVFMGTGEPLDNYDNLMRSVRILNSPEGFNIGARRITISTCGIIPGMEKLAKEGLQVELSISLHAADDKTRSLIMPVNKIYPLNKLIPACRAYISATNRQITFEYVLIKGLNSDLQNAKKLAILLNGLKLCKVNLIPANFIPELGIEPPNKLEILFFRDFLLKSGVNVTLRTARGKDIEAACGQLRLRYEKK